MTPFYRDKTDIVKLGVFLAACCCSNAQPAGQTPQAVASLQALQNARALLASGSYDQAETVLFSFNRNPLGSSEWHLESAHLLVSLAFSFRESGATPLSVVVAQRALNQLTLAETKAPASDRVVRAQIKYSIGLVNERLAGTTNQAKASYQAAVALDPQARGPVSALARLQKAAQEADTRQKKKPGNG